MVIPGILEKSWEEIENKIKIGSQLSNVLHIDFIDGKFVENTTFLDPKPFSKYSQDVFLEAHLMVEEPIEYLEPLAKAGFKRFIGHIEKMSDQAEFVTRGEKLGEVGLAVDGPTPISDMSADVLDLDILVLMAIRAGYSGQSFTPSYLDKRKELPEWFEKIEIDGGINKTSIKVAKDLGGDMFISNSFLFNGDPKLNYQKLTSLVASS